MAQYNKGIALRDLAALFTGSEQIRLLHEALACCNIALRERDRGKMPHDWAAAQHNKGVLLFELAETLRSNERATALREAIISYDAALSVYSRAETPGDWAMAQIGKGGALYGLANLSIGADREKLLRDALDCYEAALAVKRDPVRQSMTLSNKAVILHDLAESLGIGERARTLQQAIACYETALTSCTREAAPTHWATLQNNKGTALRDLARLFGGRQREEALRAAIACYDQALLERDYERNPSDWASTLNNKGTALENLAVVLTGTERAEKLREALACHDATARVYTRKNRPLAWSRMQHNKGVVLAGLAHVVASAEQAKVLQAAIACYDAALMERPELDIPFGWAATQSNKANALIDLARLLSGDEKKETLRQALACYDAVLPHYTSTAMPNRWAITQSNKSTVLIGLASLVNEPERDEMVRSAITSCYSALSVFTREQTPIDWAFTQTNLGDAFRTLMEELDGLERQNMIQQCVECYSNALLVYTREVLPGEHHRIAQLVGVLLFRERLWKQAIPYFASALEARDDLFTAEVTLHGRQTTLGMSRDLNTYLAYSLIRSRGEEAAREAAEVLERGRARATGEAIARQEAQLAAAGRIAPELLESYHTASQRLVTTAVQESDANLFSRRTEDIGALDERAGMQEDLSAGDKGAKEALAASLAGYEEARAARASYEAIVARIRQMLPDFLKREAVLESVTRVLQADEGFAYVATTQAGALAILLEGSGDGRSLTKIAAWWDEELTHECLRRLLVHPLPNNDRETGKGVGSLLAVQASANYLAEMREVLNEVMQTLGTAEGVLAHLALFCRAAALRRLIVVPCGSFGLLPIHAALVAASHRKGVFFIDIVQISYAPSAQIWAVCRERARASEFHEKPTALVIADPQPQEPEVRPLNRAREEGAALIDLFASHEESHIFAFVGEAATFLDVLEVLKKQMDALTHIHFACHGQAKIADPQSSGLLLAYGARLMIRHLFDPDPIHLTRLRLVVLSACQTALPGLELPDEVVGLPAGWLQAGAKGVVASLWPVSDRMTVAFMQKFYELHLLDRLDPVEALWLAQRWLRGLPSWRDDCRAAGALHAAPGPEVSEIVITPQRTLDGGGQRNDLQSGSALQNEYGSSAERGEEVRQTAATPEEYLETARHWAAFVCYGA